MKKITVYDFPDTIGIVNGYDSKEVIDLTRRNLDFLMETINHLIDTVNELRGE